MAEFHLPYGKTQLTFTLPDGLDVQVLAPRRATSVAARQAPSGLLDGGGLWSAAIQASSADEMATVAQALDSPLSGRSLTALRDNLAGYFIQHPQTTKRSPTVAIAVNDKTRPVPHQYLLPPLLARLEAMGIAPEAITLIIATGAHPPMQPDEFGSVVPQDILARYPVLSHDAEDTANLVYLGQTTRGTPVWANRRYIEADLRIVVGDIEPHQFMGFSGGVKSAAIGLAGKQTINANHAMMTDPKAQIGRYDDNPCRQDVEEIGRMMGVHFAVNAVLDEERHIIQALAGDPAAVMQAGIPVVRQVFEVAIAKPFDLMIVSPGGHPKDINLYQAQKALGHATLVMKPGGTVILAAACPEGSGSQAYEAWMAGPGMTSHEAVLERYAREGYRIGPHKAYQISRDASRVRLWFVTDMAPDFAQRLLLNPVANLPGMDTPFLVVSDQKRGMDPHTQLERALSMALRDLPPSATIGVMPWANTTIPTLSRCT